MKIKKVVNLDRDLTIHIIDFDDEIEIQGKKTKGIILLGDLPDFLADLEPIETTTFTEEEINLRIAFDEAIKSGKIFNKL